ncbi:lysoplasmalogenase [Tenacibaculum finnmarkense genomovar finnmarkense]|uniref:lysoplasmalogenase n=1 Tax=Tenacibaculum finnmarkense TaxID=2781243 RepID=UPI001E3F8120|nr:lysoplasmalogenase [Tenacibaculum finnmarkense]MCD8418212.1 lysoplasmalogenase [Tenacibaculum finnmarkense genomovar finnmarkense]MCG8186543.1 lysoplasmalogenase [Tenacibaculum finnmarkense genomovar finnmarkense]MCG8203080.1 lysoplasmalogenase [Tenacibaculum finnmarkense genomovar finnmarkense]MCG8210355.1 lysoplasmalogenase [Tenacibaculum finnmarkense genomovar finnmarkense]MCG8213311.1 lysoplasmalogenase [Tenacibaculum finnmarkense genomovar finnmarkense]
MRIKIASIIFLIIAILDVYAVITQHKSLEILCKPLLMTSLVIVYLVSLKKGEKANFWLVSALFFSFWGDVFLLDKTNYFVFGLGSFLVAHIMYIKMTANFLKKTAVIQILKSAVIFVALFVTIFLLIKDNLGEMLVPVLVYGTAISGFGTCALLNYQQEKSTENTVLLLGAILFIASDSGIALNNFYSPKHFFDIAIIILYVLAQFLIVKAILLRK